MANDQVDRTVVSQGPARAAGQATARVTQLPATDPTGEAAQVAESLQATLVELIDLSLHAKQAHWNLVGPSFKPIHLLLDELTDQYRDWYDEVAERLAAIGVSADGRIATVSAGTPLEPLPAGQLRDQDVLAFFDARVTLVADRVRARLDPIGAHDLLSQHLLLSIVLGLDDQCLTLGAYRSGST
jgi:starvation-inducible DNA-binding protein